LWGTKLLRGSFKPGRREKKVLSVEETESTSHMRGWKNCFHFGWDGKKKLRMSVKRGDLSVAGVENRVGILRGRVGGVGPPHIVRRRNRAKGRQARSLKTEKQEAKREKIAFLQ